MKRIVVLFAVMALSASVLAQKIPDYGFNKIRIVQADKVIQAALEPVTSTPQVETDRLYYWAGNNAIHTTQGGFSGRLLNGEYAEYYLNKNLQQQGSFREGLRDGIWKYWDEKGTLLELYTWEKGVKSGEFELFDNKGGIKQLGYYKSNLLNGRIKTYNGTDTAVVTVYKQGKIIMKKPSAFWRKVNILKKKDTKAKLQ